jgi:hypothetical protein
LDECRWHKSAFVVVAEFGGGSKVLLIGIVIGVIIAIVVAKTV